MAAIASVGTTEPLSPRTQLSQEREKGKELERQVSQLSKMLGDSKSELEITRKDLKNTLDELKQAEQQRKAFGYELRTTTNTLKEAQEKLNQANQQLRASGAKNPTITLLRCDNYDCHSRGCYVSPKMESGKATCTRCWRYFLSTNSCQTYQANIISSSR